MPSSEITHSWPGRIASDRAIHLRLDSLRTTGSPTVATVNVLYMLRGTGGSLESDTKIVAVIYEWNGSQWRLVDRRVLLIT